MTITVELPDEQAAALREQAQSRGLSLAEWIAKLAGQTAPALVPPGGRTDEPPIWELIAESMKNVPAEDLALLPKDGASQIDHYLYGHPKTKP